MKEKFVSGRMRACLRSNQGFTIVELLSSLMIFAFFSIALLQFMSTASTVSSRVNSTTNLSVQSQVALGLIEEYLIDCSGMVYFDDDNDALYIVNNQDYSGSLDSDQCKIYVFRYDSTKKELNFHEFEGEQESNNLVYVPVGVDDTATDYTPAPEIYWTEYRAGTTSFDFTSPKPELVSKNIESFHVELYTEDLVIDRYTTVQRHTSANITFEMSSDRDTYAGTTYMVLRNLPVVQTCAHDAGTTNPLLWTCTVCS